MASSTTVAVAICLLGLLVGSQAQYASIYAAVTATPTLSVLKAAIDAAKLDGVLKNGKLAYTVFAPTDEAFTAALAELGVTVEQLLGSGDVLASILKYHVVPAGALKASQIKTGTTAFATLGGAADTLTGGIKVQKSSAGVKVLATGSTADVVVADVAAGSAQVHVVDAVLYPFYTSIAQAATSTPALSTLVAAVGAAGLVEALSDPQITYTVFAPTNDAFSTTLATLGLEASALLADKPTLTSVLQYHVVPQAVLAADVPNGTVDTLLSGKSLTLERVGSAVTVKPISNINANVIIADVPIGPGPRSVVHVIDQVLFYEFSSVAQAASASGLNTLLAAVVAEGSYVATLSDPKFKGTVFAPTDDAFAKLLKALKVSAEELLADKQALRDILRVHVVAGVVAESGDLSDGQKLRTLYGANTLQVIKKGSAVSIKAAKSTAKVVVADVPINFYTAVVHVIDTVLLPKTISIKKPAAGLPCSTPTA